MSVLDQNTQQFVSLTNHKISEIQQMADDLASKEENIVFEIEHDHSSHKKRASEIASMTEVKKSSSFQNYTDLPDSS